MLSYGDPRWAELKGGYRVPYDPRPALNQLETSVDKKAAWDELWNELHHQCDVGEASYAAVPHLVRIHKEQHCLDWNLYALASVIEIQRRRSDNPPVPQWLAHSYRDAWRTLVDLAIDDLGVAIDHTTVEALLGAIALGKGLVTHGVVIIDFTEDELLEILQEQRNWTNLQE